MPRVSIKDLDSTEKGVGADMMLYFNSTFIRVSKDGGKPEWAQYQGSTGAGHLFRLEENSPFPVPYGDPKTFVEWVFPTGWFNTAKSAVFCERVPKRQYLKGIHTGANFSISTAESIANECGMLTPLTPEDVETLEAVKVKLNINTKFIKELFEKSVYPSVEEAYVAIKSKKAFSRALNPELALMPHPASKDLVIFCDDIPIAEMVTKNKVQMMLPSFKPECSAFFTEKGISVV
jgi:hypothetical protein